MTINTLFEITDIISIMDGAPFIFKLIWIGIIGLFIGSYLNVVIFRTPLNHERHIAVYLAENHGSTIEAPSRLDNRSICLHCKERIPAWLNVPLFSFLFLKGKTKCCNKPLSIQYPLIELLSGLTLAGVFWSHPIFDLQLIFMICMVLIGITISAIDYNCHFVSDLHAACFVAFAVLIGTESSDINIPLKNAIYGTAGLALFATIYQYLRNKLVGSDVQIIGDGDWALIFALLIIIAVKFPDASVTTYANATFCIAGLLAATYASQAYTTSKNSISALGVPAGPAIITVTLLIALGAIDLG